MITSTSNPQIKRLLQLQKKAKVRDEENVFVVEGLRMFAEVPKNRVEKLYISESLYNRKKHDLNLQEFPVNLKRNKHEGGRYRVYERNNETHRRLQPHRFYILTDSVKERRYRDLALLPDHGSRQLCCRTAC